MKLLFLVIAIVSANSLHAQASDLQYGIFEGRTPCKELSTYLNEAPREACIKIKWRLILYKDSLTGSPSHYELSGFVFKRDKPQTGTWKIIKGTASDAAAIVYELTIPGRPSLRLLQADENILIFLDEKGNPF